MFHTTSTTSARSGHGSAEVSLPVLPRVGDTVLLRQDVLAEVARSGAMGMPTWRFLASATRGKLIGWRDRDGERSRAIVDIAASERRLVVFVTEHLVTRAP